MKVAIVLALCIASVAALPNHYGAYDTSSFKKVDSYAYAVKPEVKLELVKGTPVPILKYELNDDHYGTYNVDVKTGDGQSNVESGKLVDLGNPKGLTVFKEGSYSFTSPEGKVFTVNWKSDEKGFQAFGDHLPTSPPMPEEIRKGLLIPRIPEFQNDNSKVFKVDSYNHNGYGYGN